MIFEERAERGPGKREREREKERLILNKNSMG